MNLVLFLGAGFSHGFDKAIPCSGELMGSILKEIAGDHELAQEKASVLAAIRKIFPWQSEITRVPFETLLGILDDARHEKRPRDTLKTRWARQVWDGLISGLGLAVHYKRPPEWKYQKWNFRSSPIKPLIGIIKKCQSNSTSLTIITTNYDLVVDSAVVWCNDRKYRHLYPGASLKNPIPDLRIYNYGIKISGLWSRGNGNPTLDTRQKTGKPWGPAIYKLHGSVNWVKCSNCNRIHLSRSREDLKAAFSLHPLRCASHKCKGFYERVIIPPTPQKAIHEEPFDQIWQQAHSALCKAQRVVFIGYSLPEADPNVAQMVVQSRRLSGSTSGRYWDYWLWTLDAENDVFGRFRALLGPPARRKRKPFTPQKFLEEWINEILS